MTEDEVLEHLGICGLGFYRALVMMEERGIPITYATIQDFTNTKRRATYYNVKALSDLGAITVSRTGGGRGNESVINCARNCAENRATECTVSHETVHETVQETVQETVHDPPSPLSALSPLPPTTPSKERHTSYVERKVPAASEEGEKTPAKRATQLPSNFAVTDDMRQKAIGYGVPIERIDFETEKFMNFHGSKGSVFKDWRRAWYTWMQNAPSMSHYPVSTNGRMNGKANGVASVDEETWKRNYRERYRLQGVEISDENLEFSWNNYTSGRMRQ